MMGQMAIGLALAIAVAAPARAGSVAVSVAGAGVSVPVVSLKEAKFTTVVRQRYDFSCGSAAVATLLTHHYGRPTTEEQAFAAMFNVGNQAEIRQHGFSLLDVRNFLQLNGIRADGFRIGLDDVGKVGIPAITLVTVKGYKHFVVVKGLTDTEVLVGDPALGLRVMPREQFEAASDGVFFLVRDDIPTARTTFNRESEWGTRGKGPLSAAMETRGLASFTLMLPGLNEF